MAVHSVLPPSHRPSHQSIGLAPHRKMLSLLWGEAGPLITGLDQVKPGVGMGETKPMKERVQSFIRQSWWWDVARQATWVCLFPGGDGGGTPSPLQNSEAWLGNPGCWTSNLSLFLPLFPWDQEGLRHQVKHNPLAATQLGTEKWRNV